MTSFRPGHLMSTLPLALGLSACVADGADSGLTILRAVVPEAGCTFSTTTDQFFASGIIEADTGGYLLAPVVRNDLVTAEGEGVSGKTVFLTGARIEIQFYDDDLFSDAEQAQLATDGLTRFEVPFGASVEPNGGTAVVPFEAVPIPLLRQIGRRLPVPTEDDPDPRAVIDVRMRMTGTIRGDQVESNLFRFPVQVCNGCLTNLLGRCVDVTPSTPVRTGGVCQLGQDAVVDCCNSDHDDLEVSCPMGETPPPGMACDDGIDQPTTFLCPGRPLEL